MQDQMREPVGRAGGLAGLSTSRRAEPGDGAMAALAAFCALEGLSNHGDGGTEAREATARLPWLRLRVPRPEAVRRRQAPAATDHTSPVASPGRRGIPAIDQVTLRMILDRRTSIVVTAERGQSGSETAAMLAHVLHTLGACPSWILDEDAAERAPLPPVHRGTGDLIVTEADPSVLAELDPDICVVTGIRPDRIGRATMVIGRHDDPAVRGLADDRGPGTVVATYGHDEDATWTIDVDDHFLQARGPDQQIVCAELHPSADIDDAVAALAAAAALGIDPGDAAWALESYRVGSGT